MVWMRFGCGSFDCSPHTFECTKTFVFLHVKINMRCLIIGRGRKLNEINLPIKAEYENGCDFISIYKFEGPDILGKFEDLVTSEPYDHIYFDLHVQQFLIYVGDNGKGIGPENNELVRQAFLHNVAPGGSVFLPASKAIEDNIEYQMRVGKAYRELAGKEFKITRPNGQYPLMSEDAQSKLASFYYKFTRK